MASPLVSSISLASPRDNLIKRRWQSSNRTLSPLTLESSVLYLNGESTVEAWDIESGQLLWQKPLPHKASFRPRLTDRSLIVSGPELFEVYDKRNGKLQWQYRPTGRLGVPVLHDERVYFGERHRLRALDVKNGKRLWHFDTDNKARIAYAPIGFRDRVLLGPGDGQLYALDKKTGEPVWRVDRESDWQYLRQLGIHDQLLIAGGYHDEVFGIDLSDGSITWRFYAGNFVNSQLVVDGKVCFWSPTGWIYALDASSGKVIWRHKTVDYNDRRSLQNWASVVSELVASNGRLYVLAMDHVLHVLDLNSGEEIDAYMIPEAVRPFVCLNREKEGDLYLGTVAGEVLNLSLG